MNIFTLNSKFQHNPVHEFEVELMVKRVLCPNITLEVYAIDEPDNSLSLKLNITKYSIDTENGILVVTTVCDATHKATQLPSKLLLDFYDVSEDLADGLLSAKIHIHGTLEETIPRGIKFNGASHQHMNTGIVSVIKFAWNVRD